METYKKPVVAGKNEPSSSVSIMPVPTFPVGYLTKKLFGDDDFHKEESLTPRKNFVE